MDLSPLPDTPFSPSANYLSIGPSIEYRCKDVRLPSLRIKVTVDLLIPAQSAPAKARKPRYLEEAFDVLVPIGHKIGLEVRVEQEGTGLIKHPSTIRDTAHAETREDVSPEWEEGRASMQSEASAVMRKLLISNKAILALDSIRHTPQAAFVTLENPEPNSSTIILKPLISDIQYSPLHNNLIVSGAPIAYLKDISLSIWWSMPKRKPRKAEDSNSQGNQVSSRDTQNVESQDVQDDDEDALVEYDDHADDDDDTLVDYDDDILMNDDDNILIDVAEEDAVKEGTPGVGSPDSSRSSSLHSQSSQSPSNYIVNDGESSIGHETPLPDIAAEDRTQTQHTITRGCVSGELIPQWARSQLVVALQKVVKIHMMKRFPLIFDGTVHSYTPTMISPTSLTRSMARMLALSRTHQLTLHSDAIERMTAINSHLEKIITDRVRYILQTSKRLCPVTSQHTNETYTGPKKRKRRKIVEESIDPVEEYLADLRGNIRKRAKETRNSEEAKVRWVINDALGRIGRGCWAEKRRGSGKMSLGRLQLELCDNIIPEEEETASAAAFVDESPISVGRQQDSSPSVDDDLNLQEGDDEDMLQEDVAFAEAGDGIDFDLPGTHDLSDHMDAESSDRMSVSLIDGPMQGTGGGQPIHHVQNVNGLRQDSLDPVNSSLNNTEDCLSPISDLKELFGSIAPMQGVLVNDLDSGYPALASMPTTPGLKQPTIQTTTDTDSDTVSILDDGEIYHLDYDFETKSEVSILPDEDDAELSFTSSSSDETLTDESLRSLTSISADSLRYQSIPFAKRDIEEGYLYAMGEISWKVGETGYAPSLL